MNKNDMEATLDEVDRDTVMNEAYADWLKLSDVLHLFFEFIDSFDGSSTAFATAEPMMDKIFHEKFTFLTGMYLLRFALLSIFCSSHTNYPLYSRRRPKEPGLVPKLLQSLCYQWKHRPSCEFICSYRMFYTNMSMFSSLVFIDGY